MKKLEQNNMAENSIEITGMYSKNKTTNRFFPYTTNTHQVSKDDRVPHPTDCNVRIYQAARDYFDIAVDIIQQDTGIFVRQVYAKRMLENYVASNAHLYYWATKYNIPWMFLYFCQSEPLIHKEIKIGSQLYYIVKEIPNVKLVPADYPGLSRHEYVKVEREDESKFLDLSYCFIDHEREIKNDEVVEEMELSVFSGAMPPHKIWGTIKMKINETRFSNLVQSSERRNLYLTNLANEIMRDYLD